MSGPDMDFDDTDVTAQASAWFLRLRNAEGDTADVHARFQDWLAADPAHAQAFNAVEATWGVIADNASAPELMVARHDALKRVRGAVRRRWGFPAAWSRRALAAGLACLIAVPAALLLWPDPQDVYETATGETRTVILKDGSRVALDARTQLSVSYTDDARTLRLERGQAQFDVAKDPTRPFRVTAGDQTVVALGTAFNVEMIKDRVLVTLLEGKVTVTQAGVAAEPQRQIRELAPGQQLVAKPNGPATLQTVNLDSTVSWRTGKLVFRDEPLSSAIERMNRHSHTMLKVADPSVAAIGVSGIFNTGDTDAFVDAVVNYFPVATAAAADGTITFVAAE